MFAATFIATSAGIDVTPANLATIAFLSICAAMGCPAIPIAGTTLIVTILSGLGWTSDACMIAYAIGCCNQPSGRNGTPATERYR